MQGGFHSYCPGVKFGNKPGDRRKERKMPLTSKVKEFTPYDSTVIPGKPLFEVYRNMQEASNGNEPPFMTTDEYEVAEVATKYLEGSVLCHRDGRILRWWYIKEEKK